MKTLLSSSRLTFVAVLLAGSLLYAQLPSTTLRVMNTQRPAANQVEFDVWLKNTTSPGPEANIEYAGGQFHFSFNKAVLNGGTGTLTIVSSGMGTLAPKNPTVVTTTTPGQLRTAAPTPPGAGSGLVIPTGDSVKVATFRLTTSVSAFSQLTFDLVVRNSTAGNPFTKFGAYISSVNTEIQNGSTYFNLDPNPILPVELTSFIAAGKGRDMKLEWKTATEVNSSKFEIERSVVKGAQREWKTVASVNAAGNSNSPREYSFVDKKLNTGKYAYRLKMIDADGTFDYSAEAEGSVDKPATFDLSQNYPNPFNPSTRIDFQVAENAQITLELFSISGERIATLINEQMEPGYYTQTISSSQFASGLASGMYIYRLTTSGKAPEGKFVSTKKMILMK